MVRKSRNEVGPVSKEERNILHETGMFSLAKRRTRNIVSKHCMLDSKISTVASDCYLQGVRDASQALLSEEANDRPEGPSR